MIRSLTTMVVACLMFGCAAAQGHYVLDSSFHQDGYLYPAVNEDLDALAVQPDGKVLVGTGMPWLIGIWRYLPDGTPDSTWGLNGFAAHGFGLVEISKILVRDSMVYYCGVGAASSNFSAYVAALDLSGAPVSAYGNGGITWFNSGPALYSGLDMAMNDNHELYMTGNSQQGEAGFLLRLTPSGQLDLAFDGDGVTYLPILPGHEAPSFPHILLDANQQPVVQALVNEDFGSFSQGKLIVLRYLTNGTLDSNFGLGGSSVVSHPSGNDLSLGHGILARPSGGFWLGSSAEVGVGRFQPMICALTAQGELDTTFSSGGILLQDSALGMAYGAFGAMTALPGDGLLLVGSLTDSIYWLVALTAIDASGQPDLGAGLDGVYLHSFGMWEGFPAGVCEVDSSGRVFSLGQLSYSIPNYPDQVLSCYRFMSTPLGLNRPTRNRLIYPNPTSPGQWLQVGAGISHLSLIDVQGRVLREWSAPDERIAVPDVPGGLYFLRGMDAAGPFSERLLLR